MPTGTLYVVATPLGNLGDLTPRAADILRGTAVVAAEDTRRTRGLLTHLGASPRLLSFHHHSERRRLELILDLIAEGHDVALVSDAGTPVVSDPGADLVAAVRARGGNVVPIPGVSAVATTLSVCGFAGDRYVFLGFIPKKGAERNRLIHRAVAEEWPVVLFEAPGRLVGLLRDLAAAGGGERRGFVARELTKLHEELRSGSLTELADYFSQREPRGEITVVLDGTGEAAGPPDRSGEADGLAREWLAGGMSRRDVVERLVTMLGLPRNDAYRRVMEMQ